MRLIEADPIKRSCNAGIDHRLAARQWNCPPPSFSQNYRNPNGAQCDAQRRVRAAHDKSYPALRAIPAVEIAIRCCSVL